MHVTEGFRWIIIKIKKIYALRLKEIIYLAYKVVLYFPIDWLVCFYNKKTYRARLLEITTGKTLFLYPAKISWKTPLFQRPHQLASCLAGGDYLYFFCSDLKYDSFHGIKMISMCLYLVNKKIFKNCLNFSNKKILILQPNTLQNFSIKFFHTWLELGNTIIYDYLDELNEKVFGLIDHELQKKHFQILSEERIICLATARELYNNAKKYRAKNLHYLPNAVNVSHFEANHATLPRRWLSLILKVKSQRKQIIGYFGAIAQWLDYELLIKIACQHQDKIFFLIGHFYDSHYKKYIKQLTQYNNVVFSEAVPYGFLPQVAKIFDVSIIPFLIDEVTIATSPVKLFEYMALGKPIISTAIPECQQYQSVLIANSHEEFSELIHVSIKMPSTDNYFAIQKQEALANTWESRAKKIKETISNLIPP